MRRILWILLLCSFLYGFARSIERYRTERGNRQVEIALDYDAFLDLCQRDGLPIKKTLEQFKALGVSTIAPSEMTIEKFHQAGQLVLIRGEDLPLYPGFDAYGYPGLFKKNLIPPYPALLMKASEPSIKPWLSSSLPAIFGKERVGEIPNGFAILGKSDDIIQSGLGISPAQARNFVSLGFGLSPQDL